MDERRWAFFDERLGRFSVILDAGRLCHVASSEITPDRRSKRG
jgi:hypothetical protein